MEDYEKLLIKYIDKIIVENREKLIEIDDEILKMCMDRNILSQKLYEICMKAGNKAKKTFDIYNMLTNIIINEEKQTIYKLGIKESIKKKELYSSLH